MYKIARRQAFSDTTFLWDVEAPDVARAAQPGQFVMVRLDEGGERIPLTIADYDREAGTITLVVQAVGKTTNQMMSQFAEGDRFLDFVGPLGLESELENWGHVVVIGGGLGVAPVFPQLRAFKEAGNKTTAIIGFRNEGLVFWEEEFRPWCDELIVCTDDGSYGRKGFVTNALQDVLQQDPRPDRVVAVGPLPMMNACSEVSRRFDVPTVVSLNAIMVDGTGMCGSCRVNIDGEIKFACVDGPEFDAHKVDFGELSKRQKRFRREEVSATDQFDEVCGLEQKLFKEEKRNYKKIKELPPKATEMPERDAEARSKDFSEVNIGYSMDHALEEAARCIQCRKPTCIAGCPVSIDIPRFIRHIMVRDIEGARDVIRENNLFPSICGRVCPQESQCEAQCIIAKKVEAVAIGRLERFVGDNARSLAKPPARPESDRGKVAIVGSGPGGLACAADLAKAGVDVTVYEALHTIGGVLSYGIPAFRLPRTIIDREIDGLRNLGVKFETNKVVGKTFSIEQMRGEMGFDAVFVATGAGYPMFLGIPGEQAGRVYSANEFLTRINLMGGDRFPYEDTPVSMGDSVVVFGAGNTAMDCLRVSKRVGASTVRCVYRRTEAEAPARIEEIRHAKEEGVEFKWRYSPLEILADDDGMVTGIKCQKMFLGPPDDSGRRRPQALEGEVELFECDTVIYALGTRANPIIAQSTPNLETHRGGHIVADDETQATSMPGVFAGGDIVTGGATVILAMGAGRRAAAAMLQFLDNKAWPPSEDAAPEHEHHDANACPRCQRPLEGEEIYVCCANTRLTWHCDGCKKVYEGFAFPYGLCASCGGHLALQSVDLDIEAEEAQQAIRRAFEIELGGMNFYQKSAREVDDLELKRLFGRLAKMEVEHMVTLTRRYHVEPPDAGELSLEHIALYTGVEVPQEPTDVLRLAIRLEERARNFFRDQSAKLEENTPAWTLYRELEAEEQEHVDLLETELARLAAGKPGML